MTQLLEGLLGTSNLLVAGRLNGHFDVVWICTSIMSAACLLVREPGTYHSSHTEKAEKATNSDGVAGRRQQTSGRANTGTRICTWEFFTAGQHGDTGAALCGGELQELGYTYCACASSALHCRPDGILPDRPSRKHVCREVRFFRYLRKLKKA